MVWISCGLSLDDSSPSIVGGGKGDLFQVGSGEGGVKGEEEEGRISSKIERREGSTSLYTSALDPTASVVLSFDDFQNHMSLICTP